jgi:hypothetical protein
MTRGDAVKYMSLTSELYDARITAVRKDGTLDLDVLPPGTSEPVRVTKIRVLAAAQGGLLGPGMALEVGA